jgi:hypothetical protein
VAIILAVDGGSGTAHASLTPATNLVWDGTLTGTNTTDTTVKEHGYGSIKHDSGAGAASAYLARNNCLADAGRRISMRFLYTSAGGLPIGGTTAIMRVMTSASAQIAQVTLDSAGKLRLYAGASGNTLQQTGATTVTADTWHRIVLAYTITSASVSEWRVYLDGVLELTASNPSSQVTASAHFRFGWIGSSAGANRVLHTQDHYIDDDATLTDTGDVRVTNKVPNALGYSNAFPTAVGTGTNRWDRVSERPTNTSNYWAQTATTQVVEAYTVQDAATGDDDLTGATLLGYCPWVSFALTASAGSTLASLVTPGPTFTTLTTTSGSNVSQVRFLPITSASYPSSNDAVGLRSTGTAVDTRFFEAGVWIVYTLGSAGDPIAGESVGASDAVLNLDHPRPVEGESTGTSPATADVRTAGVVDGLSSGVSTATLAMTVGAFSGSSSGVSAATADVRVARGVAGTSSGLSAATADIRATGAVSGNSSGLSDSSAHLVHTAPLEGESVGTSTATNQGVGAHRIAGTSSGVSSATANITVPSTVPEVAGTSVGTSAASANPGTAHRIAGTSTGLSDANAHLTTSPHIAGSSTGVGEAAVDPKASGSVGGVSIGVSDALWAPSAGVGVAGTSTGTSSAMADIRTLTTIAGESGTTSPGSAGVSVGHAIAGLSIGTSSATGRIGPYTLVFDFTGDLEVVSTWVGVLEVVAQHSGDLEVGEQWVGPLEVERTFAGDLEVVAEWVGTRGANR